MPRKLFDACSLNSRTVDVSCLIDYLKSLLKTTTTTTNSKDMDHAIGILKDLLIYCCECEEIESTTIDYMTFSIVFFIWIEKVSTEPAELNTLHANTLKLMNIAKSNFNSKKIDSTSSTGNELNDEYLKKLEYDNKQLNSHIDRLKQQIESLDELNMQLNSDLDAKIKDNEK